MRQKLVLSIMVLSCLLFSGCRKQNENLAPESGTENLKESHAETDAESSDEEKTADSAAQMAEESVSRDLFAMDTYMTVTAYGETAQKAVDDAAAEIERLDSILSAGDENSEIYALNQQGGGTVSEDTKYLLERSLEIWKDTDGIFEISIYPIMQSWGFTSGEYRVPSEEELEELLTLADSSQIVMDEENAAVSFEKEGMQIDLGGIAKGYTSSEIMDIFREEGVTSGLVSLGGNVQVLGRKPDGSRWRVAIQSPSDAEEYLGILEAEDCAVITSGGYERFFEEDGIRYHHIIDPSTGYPADSGLDSVTIVSADGTLADGLSTSLFIMGKEKAEEYWKEHSEEFDAILLDKDGNLYVTEGIADRFTSDMDIQIWKK